MTVKFQNLFEPYKWSLSIGELEILSGTISGSFLPDMGPSTTVERYENIFDTDDFDSEFVDFARPLLIRSNVLDSFQAKKRNYFNISTLGKINLSSKRLIIYCHSRSLTSVYCLHQ